MSDISNYQHPVILFDGVCNLCTGVVQFIIKRDKKDVLKFASLQSTFGSMLIEKYHLSEAAFNSFILLDKGKIYRRSTAALLVAKHLSGLWPAVYLFIIVPPFIRDGVYDLIAKNRYKWFGKKEVCWMPTENLKRKFLD